MINGFKHILWDWNGTLFNDMHLCIDIVNGLLKKKSLDTLTLEKYREIFTFPVRDYYVKAGFDFNSYSFEDVGMEWILEYEVRKEESKLFDGAAEVIAHIASLKKEQSILSAYSLQTLLDLVKYHGIYDYFTHISGLDHVYATSKLETGRELLSKLSVSPEDVVLIGDTVHDYDVAQELGIHCILIANGHQDISRLSLCGVPVIKNIKELLPK